MYKFGKENNYTVYFKVPYEDKDEAKKNGYRWDAEKKSWYKYLYLNKNNNFKLVYDLCEKNNLPDVFIIFNNIKKSQELQPKQEPKIEPQPDEN